jgi:XTP/dITP diphosphohydrolase
MNKLVVASRNKGKIIEIAALLTGLVEQVSCSTDFANFPDTIEDGLTFEDNALKKAREASRFTGLPALADDSGLVVDAIGGSPGVFSARFAGEGASDADNNLKLLEVMENIEDSCRQAAFICTLAYVTPDGNEQLFTGKLAGRIIRQEAGDCGFGYDPLFWLDTPGRTLAQLTVEEKNLISHRAQAFEQFQKYLASTVSRIK